MESFGEIESGFLVGDRTKSFYVESPPFLISPCFVKVLDYLDLVQELHGNGSKHL